MAKEKFSKTAVVPTREEDFPGWYQAVIKASELAEVSPARGCMIIRPWGYAIWERMKSLLDAKIKETGHENVYFPLFIPLSYMQKEADHVEGFAKECAVVTHHKLTQKEGGELVPDGKLEEPYIVRPTSETLIGEAFSKWVQSYRDLPMKINQWANVVRWEMRTRMFLRTVEILWQEGHTVHATSQEAKAHTLMMLDVYHQFVTSVLAIPVVRGEKTEIERFAGAEATYTIEALMQDGKALQCGTSHFLGQHFAKSADISFLDEHGQQQTAWTTSWGMSTRLVGALIMAHGDDNGLTLPPAIAPLQIVLLPILHQLEKKDEILDYCHQIKSQLASLEWQGEKIRVSLDDRPMKGGEKSWHWIKKGVPLRIEIGAREVDQKRVSVFQRNQEVKARQVMDQSDLSTFVVGTLTDMQETMYSESEGSLKKNTVFINSLDEFKSFFSEKKSGFARAYWCNDSDKEAALAKEFGVSVRCILSEDLSQERRCFLSGREAKAEVLFAKAY
ncbi:MAG TPA: proline--tRNA ligase [Gammaproteobacteria bacterium]|nr:proline--tRNA ligase [Gammaproteobacteria bacterium]